MTTNTSTPRKPRTKEYVRPISPTWWLSKPNYLKFMVRELSSAFIAGYAVFLVVLMQEAREAGSFPLFCEQLRNPANIALHLIALAFALFNTITTFNVAPRILTIRKGEDTLPDSVVAGAHYGAFLVASVVVIGLALTVLR